MNWLSIAGVIWGVLAAALLALATYRATQAEREDDSVHLVGADDRVDEQAAYSKKIESLERWVKILAVVVVVYGLAVLGFWGYYGLMSRGMR